MTAEIAVMNKSAVALAVDSAATLEMEHVHKIYMVNKLFPLSKYHPIGIMIYGNPELLGVPWETVIEMYRRKLGSNKFGTLTEYSDNLISFVGSSKVLFPEEVQKRHFRDCLFIYYSWINDRIINQVKSYTEKKKITKSKTREIVERVIDEHRRLLEKQDKLPHVSAEWVRKLLTKYASTIKRAKTEVFEKLPISPTANSCLRKIIGYLFSRDIIRKDFSGLVIADFGNDEVFPHVKSFEIEGVVNGKAKYRAGQEGETGRRNNACILPFAQSVMVPTFMEGVHPQYYKFLFKCLRGLFNERYPDNILSEIKDLSKKKQKSIEKKLEQINKSVLDKYKKDLESHSYKEHIRPILRAVSELPKDEIAIMAETLISLTSFRMRMSVDAAETVGGPIDVAVISKADGFVWIKCKRYFEQELNPHLSSC